ncbi:MAG: signal peptidase II [Gammaproteobacteria bacterium]|nr:signal peptidase II [Gammaproteobacteria bacterium]
MKTSTLLRWFSLTLLLILLDQVTKIWADSALQLYRPVEITPFFNLMLAYNPGAAFSFLSDAGGWQRWFFSLLSLVVSVVLIVWLTRLKVNEKGMAASLSLILAGAIGNLIDRLAYGHVIDFLDLYYKSHHWPAFNIADSVICIGAVIMIALTLREGKDEKKNESE